MKFLPPNSRLRCFTALFLVLLLLLSLAPTAFAEDGLTAKNIGGSYILFANGNPIRLEAGATSNLTKVFVGKNTEPENLSSVSGDMFEGAPETGYDLSEVTIVGGSDGRDSAATVGSTSITMEGGKVFRILAGNYGSESKDEQKVSRVTGNATVTIEGGTVVDYINAGRYNASIDGTFKLTITGGTFGKDCYVHAGVWGNGTEGTADYGSQVIDTTAHVKNAVVDISGVEIYLLACGGGGYTSVGTATVTVEDSTIENLYSGGINGMVEKSTITLIDTDVTSYAGVNRGYAKDVTLNVTEGSTIGELYVSTVPGAFGSDSGPNTGAGVTVKSTINVDSTSEVRSAELTPTVRATESEGVTTSTPEITSNIPLTLPKTFSLGSDLYDDVDKVNVTQDLTADLRMEDGSQLTLAKDVTLNGNVTKGYGSQLFLSEGSKITGKVISSYSPIAGVVVSGGEEEQPGGEEDGSQETAPTYAVICRKLNVRSGPGTSYERIGSLSRGALLSGVLEDGWLRFTYNGQTAYVSATYVQKLSGSGDLCVLCNALNVRTGPSTSYAKLGQLLSGTYVDPLESQNGWYKIGYNGGYGWICADYVG